MSAPRLAAAPSAPRPRANAPRRHAGALAVALACGAPLAGLAPDAHAAAFESCPSEGFLTQGSVPRTYAVDLVTGDYSIAASGHGTNRSLNAVGFNPNDRFLYAWSYEAGQPVRIHDDWQLESLGELNVAGGNFFVGDVSTELNAYYVYQKGSRKGLYAIDLDPASDAHLQMRRVVDGGALFLRIYDFAFHPDDGALYAVEADGDLHRIDPIDGSSVKLGNTGQTGTFGATYFDGAGNLYIGNNRDGKVYRIRLDSGDYTAELFANGPAASTNDGARCALAPLRDEAAAAAAVDVDYGDAPDSYGTLLASNGARHGLLQNPGLFLGSRVDGEGDGYAFPLSDDGAGPGGDDDAVQLVSSPVAGEPLLATVEASGAGYLNAWIDLDRNGRFDADEQVLVDRAVRAGDNPLSIALPATLDAGDTWARFRLSSARGLEPTGGVPDGEVEDIRLTTLPTRMTVSSYPSESGWATVAFEDNWPFVGDYDMNDLVMHLRTVTHRVAAGYTKVRISGELAALGASYHNGFGIALPGVRRADVDESEMEFSINGVPVTDRSALEPGREQAILIIDEDMLRYAADAEACEYFRTEPGCGGAVAMSFSVTVPFVDATDAPLSQLFDPFLFATPGEWHGVAFSSPPGRSYEIHLKNRAPTEAFNPLLFANVGEDASAPDRGEYFLTANGMPWALAVAERWQYPAEFQDVSDAYPLFADFTASDGAQGAYWYDPATAQADRVYED